jgi:transcription elongation factor GreA
MDSGNNPTLGETAGSFLASLPAEEGKNSQQTIYRFVRWYGWERPFVELKAPEIANYAEQLPPSDADYLTNMAQIRAFLLYAKKQGWSKINLAAHLKPRKAKAKVTSAAKRESMVTSLTQEGYDKLRAEIEELKSKRTQSIEEIKKAAADKDFRENAPLEAAREARSHLEGRIQELEEILKSAVIIDEVQKDALKVSIGDSVVLCDESGEELCYTIVSPRETDPIQGKISHNSPIGKTIIGKTQGETVEIDAPVGKLRYQIKRIDR